MAVNRIESLFADEDSGDVYFLVREELERHALASTTEDGPYRQYMPGIVQNLLSRVEKLEQCQRQEQQQ